jgi:hypothetical protein
VNAQSGGWLVPTRNELEIAVEAACDRLIAKDRPLFVRDVNERSLSHKFANYLQEEVAKWGEGWDVDCEFNRDLQASGEDYAKRLHLIDKFDSMTTRVDDEHAKTVFPDVIVHKRGSRTNLLVAEMKKNMATDRSIAFDRQYKLPAYVQQLGYQAAVFVLLDMKAVQCHREWIRRLD